MKKSVKSLAVILSAMAVVSCGNTDLYDAAAVEQAAINTTKGTYAEGFAKAYPSLNLNQSWDFSTGAVNVVLPTSTSSSAKTRGTDYELAKSEYILDGTVSADIHKQLKAGDNNKYKGVPFYMRVPENPFAVVPIFQGTASYVWEFWMWVEGVGDIKIWSKGDDLAYRTSATGSYKSVGSGAIPASVYDIKTAAYTFSGLPAGKKMYFYLKITNPKQDVYNSSLNEMILSMPITAPTNIPEDNQAIIIGCEDNISPTSDFDYEDVCFMVYGKPVPPIETVEEVIEEKGKRYMMEDLGTTDDFDFNDVVVDVVERTKVTYTYKFDEFNTMIPEETKTKRETMPTVARVRAMGGTLDFNLTIGSTTWSKSGKGFEIATMYNTADPDYTKVLDEFEVTGWDAASNNISVVVNDKSGNGIQIAFPKSGEAPMIIATDTGVKWMTERTSIPQDWWTE